MWTDLIFVYNFKRIAIFGSIALNTAVCKFTNCKSGSSQVARLALTSLQDGESYSMATFEADNIESRCSV
jgi:hypothetical protein